jgi:5-methylcytosine-specific restriction endonuclease McrA
MHLNLQNTECGIMCMRVRDSCSLQKICKIRRELLAVLSSKQRSAIKRYIRMNGFQDDNSHWVSIADIIGLFSKYIEGDMKCWYCGKTMIVDTEPNGKPFSHNMMTLDHRLSLANGGSNSVENMVFCCFSCNRAKGLAEQNLPEWQKVMNKAPDAREVVSEDSYAEKN